MKCYANYQTNHDMPEVSSGVGGRKLDSATILTKLLDARTRERFWSYVRRTPKCWLWTGSTTGQLDHGQFHLGRIRGRVHHAYAHRVAWLLLCGPIPTGQQVNHHCDVPTCVNPDHLYLGTQGDNNRDAYRRHRQPKTRARKMTSTLADEARNLRARGWTLQSLATRYGVSVAYMSLLCRGLRRPPIDDSAAIGQAS
jgi:HNH endonuclease